MKINILATSRSGHNWIGSVVQSWFPDVEVQYLTNVLPENLHQYTIKRKDINLVIYRSYRNFLASSIMSYLSAHGRDSGWRIALDRFVSTWDAIYKEIKDPIYFGNFTVIYYDDFIRYQWYRQGLCESLNGVYTEDKLDFMPNEGGGSSFDNFKYQGSGSEMKVLNRHEEILDTEWADIYIEYLFKDGTDS